MAGTQTAARVTRREREVAALIGHGLTNRAIATKLSITERTVGSHVQNLLNKLGASNRAQIATWSALDSAPAAWPRENAAAPSSQSRAEKVVAVGGIKARQHAALVAGFLALVALVVAVTDDAVRPSLASEPPRPVPGSLVYEANLRPGGEGFSTRYVLGDPAASDIRYVDGAVEFAVLKPDGDTGNNLAMPAMERYYAEAELSFSRGSNLEFWINLGSNGYAAHIGDHLIDFQAASELVQMQYANFADQNFTALGPQVLVPGLQSGRRFTIAAIVDPPRYTIFLDGRRIVSIVHGPSAQWEQISYAIFGQGGTVRLTSMRVYRLTAGAG